MSFAVSKLVLGRASSSQEDTEVQLTVLKLRQSCQQSLSKVKTIEDAAR